MVLLTVNEQCWDSDPAIILFGCLNPTTKQRLKDIRPIVINSCGQSARLTQRFFIDLDVFVCEDIAADGRLFIHPAESGEIIRAGPRFGQARQLEKEHVPTVSQLPQSEVRAPGGRRWHLHCHQPGNHLRMSLSERPSY